MNFFFEFIYNVVKKEITKILGIQATWSPLPRSREHLTQYEPKTIDELPARSMQDSFTSAIIPLGSDLAIREKYVTFLGSVRLGRLMEDMDLFAVWVLHKHIKLPNLDPSVPLPYTFVTLLVDQISFTDIQPKVSAWNVQPVSVHWMQYKFMYFRMILTSAFRDMWAGSAVHR